MSVPMSTRAPLSCADEPRSHRSLTEAAVGQRQRCERANEQRAPMNRAYKWRSHGSLTEAAEGPRCPFVLYVTTECLRVVLVKPRVSSCSVLHL